MPPALSRCGTTVIASVGPSNRFLIPKSGEPDYWTPKRPMAFFHTPPAPPSKGGELCSRTARRRRWRGRAGGGWRSSLGLAGEERVGRGGLLRHDFGGRGFALHGSGDRFL